MTEEEARAWIADRFGAAAIAIMQRIVDAVVDEASRQNLIAASTMPMIWSRHIVDSAQLISLAPDSAPLSDRPWIDIGSGAGFPGLVIAALTGRRTLLVEPRRRRAAFLQETADMLRLDFVEIVQTEIERMHRIAAVISARAVATLNHLFLAATGCMTAETIWLLPKGRSAEEEVEIARRNWHGVFHVEQSLTDLTAQIVIATGVRRR